MDRSTDVGRAVPAVRRPLADPLGRGQLPARGTLPPRGVLPAAWPAASPADGTPVARPTRDLAPNASLVARQDLTGDLARFRIRPDGGVPAFRAGQYVSLGLPGDRGPVLRPYSIASAPHERHVLELLIRRLDGGALTTRLWAVAPGDRLWMGPPRGLFTLSPGSAPAERADPPLLFLAAGTGLAPVMSMLGVLAERPARPTTVLLHGATTVRELAYAERLRSWSQQGWLTHHPTISRPADPANAGWTGATGRVEAHVARILDEHRIDPGRVRVFACGNDGMVASSREVLGRAGVPEHAIHSESFTPTRTRAA